MSDDRTKRGPADAARVALQQPWEVRYWTRRFSCTREELTEAVAAVGHMAADVEEWLARHRG